MIGSIKRKTAKNISRHLQKLDRSRDICSFYLPEIAPCLEGQRLYVMMSREEMVLVYDETRIVQPIEELADEEPLGCDPPIYFGDVGHRVSPIYKLTVVRDILKDIMQQLTIPVPRIFCIVMSPCSIVNEEEMRRRWLKKDCCLFPEQKYTDFDNEKGTDDTDLQRMSESIVDYMEEHMGKLTSILTRAEQDCTTKHSWDEEQDEPPKDEEQGNLFNDTYADEFARLLADFIGSEDNKEKKTDDSSTKKPESTQLSLFDDEEETEDEQEECWGDEEDNDEQDGDEDDDESQHEENEEEDGDSGEQEVEYRTIEHYKGSVRIPILKPFKNPQEALKKMVGCKDIKEQLEDLFAMTRYNQMVEQLRPNSKHHKVALHGIFYGKPGTGKTSMCKIYGSLLHEAGALSSGHVVMCSRSTFIGTCFGDEEQAVNDIIEMAKGGVLMIDEAYQLNAAHHSDPGKNVIPLLMDILSDESKRDIAIILAGYKEPMEKLLEINPGLESRFPNRFEFADFTLEELLQITKLKAQEFNYTFTPAAWTKFKNQLSEAYAMRDPNRWGNARFIANQLERIYIQHAKRCVKQNIQDKDVILHLTPSDIIPIPVPKARPRLGF